MKNEFRIERGKAKVAMAWGVYDSDRLLVVRGTPWMKVEFCGVGEEGS